MPDVSLSVIIPAFDDAPLLAASLRRGIRRGRGNGASHFVDMEYSCPASQGSPRRQPEPPAGTLVELLRARRHYLRARAGRILAGARSVPAAVSVSVIDSAADQSG